MPAHAGGALRTPILLLVFNRPDETARVMQAIRLARPRRLYVAADGPRAGRVGERAQCALARKVATTVDWPCEVASLLRTENRGCRAAVSEALDWFFAAEEEGIILEDDCVPAPTFFPFCEALLERYRHEPRVASIGGNNFQQGQARGNASYYFSKHFHCWGWATWRRAWSEYDPTLGGKNGGASETSMLRAHSDGSSAFVAYWRGLFQLCRSGRIDSWAYPFTFSVWNGRRLAIVPQVNMVTNIGTDARATHTSDVAWARWTTSRQDVVFPLTHPNEIVRDVAADMYTDRHYFRATWPYVLSRRIGDAVPVLRQIKRALVRLSNYFSKRQQVK